MWRVSDIWSIIPSLAVTYREAQGEASRDPTIMWVQYSNRGAFLPCACVNLKSGLIWSWQDYWTNLWFGSISKYSTAVKIIEWLGLVHWLQLKQTGAYGTAASSCLDLQKLLAILVLLSPTPPLVAPNPRRPFCRRATIPRFCEGGNGVRYKNTVPRIPPKPRKEG